MIKILKNSIEIEVYKETLTISRDNKFLDNDFKIQANSYPFMIVENENTRKALGSNLPTSTNRNTYHNVQVITPEGVFDGELQIVSYTKNARKCNLRFYSPIYNLKDTKIGDFLPNKTSVYPYYVEPLPEYEEKRNTLIPKNQIEAWKTFGASQITKGFPEVLFNLPYYYFPDKFGEDLDEDHEWFNFKGAINRTMIDAGVWYMRCNSWDTFAGQTQFNNSTVNQPQVYLLAPLKCAVESVGYKVTGSFYNDEFVKRLLFYSEKNNLCEVELRDEYLDIPYIAGGWRYMLGGISVKDIVFTVDTGKRYRVEFDLKKVSQMSLSASLNIPGSGNPVEVQIFDNPTFNEREIYGADFVPPYTGSSTATVTINLIRGSYANLEPAEIFSIKIYEVAAEKGYISHPIINLQRYVPEWTFIDYINELKKLFNLKITTNDHLKTISLDYFNDKFVQKTGVAIDSVYINELETNEYDSLLLKYDNEEDENVFITKNTIAIGQNKILEHTKEVASKFKYMPVTSNGLTLTEAIEDKSGVGLVIYDHTNVASNAPAVSYNNKYLTLENIYQTHHKLSFKNYLTSGVFPAETYLSTKQVKDIAAEDFVFIDNKRYYVNSMSYKETPNGIYQTKFELLLMMY